jgi:hypothetical protein
LRSSADLVASTQTACSPCVRGLAATSAAVNCQDLNLGPHPYQAHSRDAFLLVRRGGPARRWRSCDRGCPLGTGIDPWMWHVNGTTGEERLGAGGEVEALRPPARSPLFAGASNRHHLPKVGRPTPLFLPGRIAKPVLTPGAIADSTPEVKSRRLPYLPLKRGKWRLAREVGTSSLSGFWTRPRMRRKAPTTCADDAPLETAANRSVPMAYGPNLDHSYDASC